MNRIIIVLLMGMMACSCDTGPKKLGETFTELNPKTVDELVADLKTQHELKNVQVAGKIDKNCMEKGCWLSMKTAAGDELTMRFKEEKFTIPINSLGKQIVAIGDAAMVQDTVEGKAETSYEFESSGLMFK